MQSFDENLDAQTPEQIVPPLTLFPEIHEFPAQVYQRASDQLHDEGSTSNLPHIDALLSVSDFELELERQLAAEIASDDGSAGAPAQRVLPPDEAIGVTYHKKNKQWEAHLWVKDRQLGKRKKKGAQIFLGNYKSQDDAKAAHDRAALKLGVQETAKGRPYPLNFPEAAQARFMKEHADWTARDFLWKIRRFSHKFSKGRSTMKGVSVRSRKGKAAYYEAKISQTMNSGEKRTFDLGKFECEVDAGRAYDRALLFLKGQLSDCVTNFRPSEYSAAEIQEVGSSLLGSQS